MKPLLYSILCVTAVLSALSATPRENFDSAISSRESGGGSGQDATSFLQLESAWVQLPPNEKSAVWPQMSLAYVDESTKSLDENKPLDAARYLTSAGQLNQSFGGSIEYSTKSPGTFFDRLAKLQTDIASKTGVDPLAGLVDYYFGKNGGEYVVARRELDPDVDGVTIDGIAASESLVQAHYFTVREGNVIPGGTRWFIGPKGNVVDTLNHASREVLKDQYGREEPSKLQSPALLASGSQKIEIPPAPTPASVPVLSTPAPVKLTPQPSASLAPEEKSSPSSFPIVPAAIIAAVIESRYGVSQQILTDSSLKTARYFSSEGRQERELALFFNRCEGTNATRLFPLRLLREAILIDFFFLFWYRLNPWSTRESTKNGASSPRRSRKV